MISKIPTAYQPQSSESDRLRVLVIGPAGQGGIHRMMESLRRELATPRFTDIDATFIASHDGILLRSPIAVVQVIVALFSRRPDVAHINLSVRGSTYRKILIARACRIMGIPYVIHLHGSNFHIFRDQSPRWLRAAVDSLFIRSKRVVVLGQIWRDRVAAWMGQTFADRVVILPNAVADPGPKPASNRGKIHILFAGRLGPRKGVFDLLSALGSLVDDTGWRATIAGDGDVTTVVQVARAAGILDRILIPGWVDAEGIEALMRDADILALPSFDENLPMSVVEAFAHEVAVVCTPVGAVPDIVEDGISGLLVEPGDIKGLAAALRCLIDNRDLRAHLASKGRKVFENRLNIADYAVHLVAVWRAAERRR